MYKKIILIFTLFFFSVTNANSGDKLSDGSCQFDIGTGYIGTKIYINDKQNSYIILSFNDPRYGTRKYVYNGNTCKSLTSGASQKSNYDKIMQKNGFYKIIYSTQKSRYSKYTKVDKWFGATTILTVNPSKDIITLSIQPFEANIRNELNIVLNSISNKNSKYTNFSRKLKKIIDKKFFRKRIKNKIERTSSNEINYNYTLSLLSQFNNLKSFKLLLATKYFQSKYYKEFAKNASNNFLYFIQNNIASSIHNKFIKIKKPSLILEEMEEYYNITIKSGKYDIYHKVNKKCNTYYDNRKVIRSVRDNGNIYDTTYKDKHYSCTIIGSLASSRLELDTLFSKVAHQKGYSYKKNFMSKDNLIATKNREEIESKYIGVDSAKQKSYVQKQATEKLMEEIAIRKSCKGVYVGKIYTVRGGGGLFDFDQDYKVLGFSPTTGDVTVQKLFNGWTTEIKCNMIPR